MFEKASRMKLRFKTTKGMLTVEDLWDLPLIGRGGRTNDANLDDIAKELHNKLTMEETRSFVIEDKKPNEKVQLQFDIVCRIIKVRLEEKRAAESAEVAKQKKRQIMEIINRKENAALEETSIEDLRKLLENL